MSKSRKTSTLRSVTISDAGPLKGRVYQLVERKPNGEKPCEGEAHSNPFIDSCAQCMPRWGVVQTFDKIDVEKAALDGYATPINFLATEEGEAALANPLLELVTVTEKGRGFIASYCAFVLRERV